MCQCDPSIKAPVCGIGDCQWPLTAPNTRTWLGVDPGATGALALVDEFGALLDVEDVPIVVVRGKSRLSAPLIADLIRRWNPDRAIVEQVNAMPKNGGASMFAFGYGAGALEGVLAAMGVPVDFVTPSVWKRAMRLSADKGLSRMTAQRRWPNAAPLFKRVKDDGRAEAALLAEYARTMGTMTERLAA